MADVGTWAAARYGKRPENYLMHETGVGGSGLPWILYVPGGGWSRGHPSSFYVDVGEVIWRNAIHPGAGVFPVRGFSCNYGAFRYNWWDNINHAGLDPNDPAGSFDDALWPVTPRFRDTSALDVAKCVQHIKESAAFYGINPDAGIIMGASAGGQIAGHVAYDISAPFSAWATSTAARPGTQRRHSRVIACHLRQTPADWTQYLYNGGAPSHAGLYGFKHGDQAAWESVSQVERESLSPGPLVRIRRHAVPTWAHYSAADGTLSDANAAPFQIPASAWADLTAYIIGDRRHDQAGGAADDAYYCIQAHTSAAANDRPDSGTNWEDFWEAYSAAPYHHPVNGELLAADFAFIGQQFVFEHTGNDLSYPDQAYLWMKDRWNAALNP